jgi:predicted component of type VI protein secretion system
MVMVKADGSSKEFNFDKPEIIIGRDEGAKLRIPIAAVSRKHCQLIIEDDELVVRDLGSANGTYVNGVRTKERELSPGDLLTIGGIVFVVKIDGHPHQIDVKDCYAAGMVAVADDDDDDFFPTTPSSGQSSGSPSGKSPPPAPGSKLSGLGSLSDDKAFDDLLKDLGKDDDRA